MAFPRHRSEADNITFGWEGCLKYIKVSKTVHNTVFSAHIHTTDLESIERDELRMMKQFIYEKLRLF